MGKPNDQRPDGFEVSVEITPVPSATPVETITPPPSDSFTGPLADTGTEPIMIVAALVALVAGTLVLRFRRARIRQDH